MNVFVVVEFPGALVMVVWQGVTSDLAQCNTT